MNMSVSKGQENSNGKYIFDIGNVLAEFNPQKMMHHYLNDPQTEKQMYNLLFPNLWNRYDQGLISEQEIIDLLKAQFPQSEKQAQRMMNEWTDLLVINEENLNAVRQIASDCYILSNLPEKAEAALRSLNFFAPFTGALCSWREKLIKPDPEIFELFLRQNRLSAENCLTAFLLMTGRKMSKAPYQSDFMLSVSGRSMIFKVF